MQKLLAEKLCECHEDFKLYEEYSGRGMYGTKTTGVKCGSIAHVLEATIENADAFLDEEGYPLFEYLDLKWDSLGLGYIVY